jgi:ATP-dependent helicase/nuclease subunit A
VDELLTGLYAESSLLSLAAKNGGRDNLLLLRDYAARYEAGGFSGLYSFIHYINNLIESRADFDSKRPGGADEDRVQLITVHASKGLEYPVCFIAGCGSEIRDQESGPFAYVEGFGLAFRLRDRSGLALVENPAVNAIARQRAARGFEEELRILYVALTRARERLYLYGAVKKNDPEEYIKELEAQIPFLDAYSLGRMRSFLKLALVTQTGAEVHIEACAARREETAETEGDALPEEISAQTPPAETEILRYVSRFTYTYDHAVLSEIPRKLSVSALTPALLDKTYKEEDELFALYGQTAKPEAEQEQAPRQTLPSFITGRKEDESARRGIATHLFMQFCDFSALREKGAKSELARLIQENFISAEDGERVRLDEIEKFRGSRLLDEILGARAVHREMRFHARMPAVLFTQDEKKRRALGEHRILVQGVIDCLFENEEGEISLIDYKTDRLPREALSDAALAAKILSDKHHEQLSYYAIAVEQMFGKRPRHIRVYSLHLGKTVDIEA